jgi:hypothetical protein
MGLGRLLQKPLDSTLDLAMSRFGVRIGVVDEDRLVLAGSGRLENDPVDMETQPTKCSSDLGLLATGWHSADQKL